ncbi:MAG: hypothetical protein ACM3SY_06245 [Candidatus Omnitrophota bacterium]
MQRFTFSKKGYALLCAILTLNIFAILVLKSRTMWETEIQRDLEEELLFRAKQYVTAIDAYNKKNPNAPLEKFDVLVEKKFLRQLYKDPMTNSDKWNVVMREGTTEKGKLLIVPMDQMNQYTGQAMLIGVSSTSCALSFKEYRTKKRYCEWAVYIGGQDNQAMPTLKFVGNAKRPPDYKDEGKGDENGDNSSDDSNGRNRGNSIDEPDNNNNNNQGENAPPNNQEEADREAHPAPSRSDPNRGPF